MHRIVMASAYFVYVDDANFQKIKNVVTNSPAGQRFVGLSAAVESPQNNPITITLNADQILFVTD